MKKNSYSSLFLFVLLGSVGCSSTGSVVDSSSQTPASDLVSADTGALIVGYQELQMPPITGVLYQGLDDKGSIIYQRQATPGATNVLDHIPSGVQSLSTNLQLNGVTVESSTTAISVTPAVTAAVNESAGGFSVVPAATVEGTYWFSSPIGNQTAVIAGLITLDGAGGVVAGTSLSVTAASAPYTGTSNAPPDVTTTSTVQSGSYSIDGATNNVTLTMATSDGSSYTLQSRATADAQFPLPTAVGAPAPASSFLMASTIAGQITDAAGNVGLASMLLPYPYQSTTTTWSGASLQQRLLGGTPETVEPLISSVTGSFQNGAGVLELPATLPARQDLPFSYAEDAQGLLTITLPASEIDPSFGGTVVLSGAFNRNGVAVVSGPISQASQTAWYELVPNTAATLQRENGAYLTTDAVAGGAGGISYQQGDSIFNPAQSEMTGDQLTYLGTPFFYFLGPNLEAEPIFLPGPTASIEFQFTGDGLFAVYDSYNHGTSNLIGDMIALPFHIIHHG